MWAGQNWNTVPDIMCIAKGIAGGLPMGLTFSRPEIIECIRVGEHSSTFSGNPLACAAGYATVEALTEDKLVDNASKVGKFFMDGLLMLKEKHRIIREVRGIGMMLALELRFDVKEILLDALKRRLLLLYSGRNIIRLLPPLVMDQDTVSDALSVIDQVLSEEEKRRHVQ
jgi:acetylornithine/LysW-gamma-L-lysine aminotransferase